MTKVLLVDSDNKWLKYYEETLTRFGVEVVKSTSYEEAFTHLQQGGFDGMILANTIVSKDFTCVTFAKQAKEDGFRGVLLGTTGTLTHLSQMKSPPFTITSPRDLAAHCLLSMLGIPKV